MRKLCLYALSLFIISSCAYERVYLGSFWWAHSSLVPSFPHIEVFLPIVTAESPVTLQIQASWIESDPDPRGDMRIFCALKRANIFVL